MFASAGAGDDGDDGRRRRSWRKQKDEGHRDPSKEKIVGKAGPNKEKVEETRGRLPDQQGKKLKESSSGRFYLGEMRKALPRSGGNKVCDFLWRQGPTTRKRKMEAEKEMSKKESAIGVSEDVGVEAGGNDRKRPTTRKNTGTPASSSKNIPSGASSSGGTGVPSETFPTGNKDESNDSDDNDKEKAV